jgi:hypothetical protein
MKTRIFSLFNRYRDCETKVRPNSFEWIQYSSTDEKQISLFSDGFVGCDGTFVYWADENGMQRLFGAHYRLFHPRHSEIVKENLEKIHSENGKPVVKTLSLITYNANFNSLYQYGFHNETTKMEDDYRRDKFISELEDVALNIFSPNEIKKFTVKYDAPAFGQWGAGDGCVRFTLDKGQSTCVLRSDTGQRTLAFSRQ